MLASVIHALRVLCKDPVFTAVAIGSLAIGIGGTSAMFSFAGGASASIFIPMGGRHADQVVSFDSGRFQVSRSTLHADLRRHIGKKPDCVLHHVGFGCFLSLPESAKQSPTC